MGEKRGVYRVLVGNLRGRDHLERWEDDIKVDLQDVGWAHGLD